MTNRCTSLICTDLRSRCHNRLVCGPAPHVAPGAWLLVNKSVPTPVWTVVHDEVQVRMVVLSLIFPLLRVLWDQQTLHGLIGRIWQLLRSGKLPPQ